MKMKHFIEKKNKYLENENYLLKEKSNELLK